MNILKAIRKNKPKWKEKFLVNTRFVLEFEGYFTQSGNSIYAHYDDMGLVASDLVGVVHKSKMTALIRLIDLMELKLALHKKDNDYNNLFVKEMPKEIIEKFIDYSEKYIILDEYFFDEDNIPVYYEKFKNIHGSFKIIKERNE